MAVPWKHHRYGSGVTATLGPGMVLSVSWESSFHVPDGEPKYNVSVLGRRMEVRAESIEQGQATAIRVARDYLNHALAQLEGE